MFLPGCSSHLTLVFIQSEAFGSTYSVGCITFSFFLYYVFVSSFRDPSHRSVPVHTHVSPSHYVVIYITPSCSPFTWWRATSARKFGIKVISYARNRINLLSLRVQRLPECAWFYKNMHFRQWLAYSFSPSHCWWLCLTSPWLLFEVVRVYSVAERHSLCFEIGT